MVFDENAFVAGGVSRIIFHELVHTADTYGRLSNSIEFRRIFEHRIKLARELLKQEGLMPLTAAALPRGERKQKIMMELRNKTGLPRPYAAYNLTECFAEVVSSWFYREYRYFPGTESVALLTPFISKSAPPHLADVTCRKALAAYRSGEIKEATELWTKTIELDSGFYQALSDRGHVYSGAHRKRFEALQRPDFTLPVWLWILRCPVETYQQVNSVEVINERNLQKSC